MEERKVLSAGKIISGHSCMKCIMFSVTGVFDVGDNKSDMKYPFMVEGQQSCHLG